MDLQDQTYRKLISNLRWDIAGCLDNTAPKLQFDAMVGTCNAHPPGFVIPGVQRQAQSQRGELWGEGMPGCVGVSRHGNAYHRTETRSQGLTQSSSSKASLAPVTGPGLVAWNAGGGIDGVWINRGCFVDII